MSYKFLDNSGLSHFWSKIKTYISGATVSKAHQLATSRSINGVYFNGSSNITITANYTSNELSGKNLDDIRTPAVYFGGGGNNCSKRPSGVDSFGLFVYKSASGYLIQELTSGNLSSEKRFTRQFNGASWNEWKEMKYTDTTYSNATGSKSGLMSNTDKSKLDNIASGAEVNVQSDWNTTNTGADSYIKNKPTKLPASDVYSWAKQPNKPTYSKSEVGLSNVDNTADANKNVNSANKLKTARTINGVSFDGTANITIADNTKLPLSGGTITGPLAVNQTLKIGSHVILEYNTSEECLEFKFI